MTTQSLRGLDDTGPTHWRGDRFGSRLSRGKSLASFLDFDSAFVDLMGLDKRIPDTEMRAFAEFVFGIRYPANPNTALTGVLSVSQRAGQEFFNGPYRAVHGITNCVGCHVPPLGTNGLINCVGQQIGRDMKTPYLRKIYDKVGRFNVPGA